MAEEPPTDNLVPELQPDREALYPAAAEASGLEISMDGGNDEWDWWATYTLAHVVDRIDGGDEPRSWDQRHAFQGGVTWSNEQWTISAATSIHTGWPTTGLEIIQTGVGPSGEKCDSHLRKSVESTEKRFTWGINIPAEVRYSLRNIWF